MSGVIIIFTTRNSKLIMEMFDIGRAEGNELERIQEDFTKKKGE